MGEEQKMTAREKAIGNNGGEKKSISKQRGNAKSHV